MTARHAPIRTLFLLLSALLLIGLPATAEDCGTSEHPSGNDRCVESGGSGTQGDAVSDPDDDTRGPERTNGGADEPGGPGGENLADQDGNNGCGNDQDFEDDNEGLCGDAPEAQVRPVTEKPARTDDRGKSDDGTKSKENDTDDADVLAGNGRRPVKGAAADGNDDAALGAGGGIGANALGGPAAAGVGAGDAAAERAAGSSAPGAAVGDIADAAGTSPVAQAAGALAATGAAAEVLAIAALLLIALGVVAVRKGRAVS